MLVARLPGGSGHGRIFDYGRKAFLQLPEQRGSTFHICLKPEDRRIVHHTLDRGLRFCPAAS
jgi:hypothetical protein